MNCTLYQEVIVQLQLPVYISWDSSVDRDADMLIAALDGIEAVARHLPTQLNMRPYGTGPWACGDYGSVQWYLDRSRMSNGQLDGDMLVGLLANEPWQQADPHYDFVMLGSDLTAIQGGQLLNFVFGLAGGRISVQSCFRFIRDATNRQAALRSYQLLVSHEFGHVLGLVPDAEHRHDARGGIYHGHCTNLCAMQQVMSVSEVERLDHRLRARRMLLCEDCLEHLAL